MNFNECVLVGRLTRDPEIREVGGSNVVMFTVATNRSFTKKNGEKSEKTLFMDCELWGPAAAIVRDRGVKGTTILVRGPIEQDNFQDKEGNKRTRYKLRVDFFQFGQGSVTPPESAEAPTGNAPTGDDEPF
ncbi:MAG: single-stranded DNA-binding protein [Nitrososphaera sp.]|nr:single-stranded DNA-binding protein [Nitrososphaera sp.]